MWEKVRSAMVQSSSCRILQAIKKTLKFISGVMVNPRGALCRKGGMALFVTNKETCEEAEAVNVGTIVEFDL